MIETIGYPTVLTRVQIIHVPTKTALQVRISRTPRALWACLNCPLVIGDEPGAWGVSEGQAMFDAITTAQGKAGESVEGDLHWDSSRRRRMGVGGRNL